MASSRFLPIRLVVGLGNPDPEYADTYHNIGHLAVHYLLGDPPPSPHARRPMFTAWRMNDLIAAELGTYMNLSGNAVRDILKFYAIEPHGLLVVHDDADLATGAYKLSFGRGAGGHKGVQSIIDSLGTKNFWRLRVGIRSHEGKAGELVLRHITSTDRELIYLVLDATIKKLIVKDTL